jgi:predicted small secreted protein
VNFETDEKKKMFQSYHSNYIVGILTNLFENFFDVLGSFTYVQKEELNRVELNVKPFRTNLLIIKN